MRNREFIGSTASPKTKKAPVFRLKNEDSIIPELDVFSSIVFWEETADDDGGIVASPPGQGK